VDHADGRHFKDDARSDKEETHNTNNQLDPRLRQLVQAVADLIEADVLRSAGGGLE
jgi:hypothetical protein